MARNPEPDSSLPYLIRLPLGASGVVLPLSLVAAARSNPRGPLAVIDLALPHDVDPPVADLPGVELIGLARLADELHSGEIAGDVAAVRRVVTEEITSFLAARRSSEVTPTVVALRTMATGVVDAPGRSTTQASGRSSQRSSGTASAASGAKSAMCPTLVPTVGTPATAASSATSGPASWIELTTSISAHSNQRRSS